jgi:hypothetical protein
VPINAPGLGKGIEIVNNIRRTVQRVSELGKAGER